MLCSIVGMLDSIVIRSSHRRRLYLIMNAAAVVFISYFAVAAEGLYSFVAHVDVYLGSNGIYVHFNSNQSEAIWFESAGGFRARAFNRYSISVHSQRPSRGPCREWVIQNTPPSSSWFR